MSFKLRLEQFGFILDRNVKKVSFSKKNQIRFLTSLERLTRHLSLPAAINHMLSTTTGVGVDILLDMQKFAREGGLSMSATTDWFPTEISSALIVGEKSKNINESILSSLKILKSVSGNVLAPFMWLLYPILLTSIMMVLCVFIDNNIIKALGKQIHKMPEIPEDFVTVMTVSEFVGWKLYSLLFGLLLFVISFRYFLNNIVSDFRMKLDNAPIFSAYRDLVCISFLQMYSNLISLNIGNMQALEAIYDSTTNQYLKLHILKMTPLLGLGASIDRALDTGLIDQRDIRTIKILSGTRGSGNGSGYHEAIVTALEEALDRLSTKLKRYSFFLVLIIGGVGGYIGLSAVSVVMSIDMLYEQ